MQYILALCVFTNKTKEKQNLLPQHRHINMHRNILILQMQNDPNKLFYSPTDCNWVFHPAQQKQYVKQLLLM